MLVTGGGKSLTSLKGWRKSSFIFNLLNFKGFIPLLLFYTLSRFPFFKHWFMKFICDLSFYSGLGLNYPEAFGGSFCVHEFSWRISDMQLYSFSEVLNLCRQASIDFEGVKFTALYIILGQLLLTYSRNLLHRTWDLVFQKLQSTSLFTSYKSFKNTSFRKHFSAVIINMIFHI